MTPNREAALLALLRESEQFCQMWDGGPTVELVEKLAKALREALAAPAEPPEQTPQQTSEAASGAVQARDKENGNGR